MNTELTAEDRVIVINKVGMFAASDYRNADRADANIMRQAQRSDKNWAVRPWRLVHPDARPSPPHALPIIKRRNEMDDLTDTELLDWAENNPEAFHGTYGSRWAQCGYGFRENFFNIRGTIKEAMEKAEKAKA